MPSSPTCPHSYFCDYDLDNEQKVLPVSVLVSLEDEREKSLFYLLMHELNHLYYFRRCCCSFKAFEVYFQCAPSSFSSTCSNDPVRSPRRDHHNCPRCFFESSQHRSMLCKMPSYSHSSLGSPRRTVSVA